MTTINNQPILAPAPAESAIKPLDLDKHIRTALAGFIHHHTFFAQLMADLGDLVVTEAIPTMATDGYRIMVNPQFAGKLTHDQIIYGLAHEVMHVIFMHVPRFKAYQERGYIRDDLPLDPRLANIAADCIINATLNDDKVGKFIEGGCLHPMITSEHSFEDAYAILYKDQQKNGGKGSGQQSGDGFDDHLTPSNAPGKQPKEEGAVQRAVVMAEQSAKAVGKMPGGLQRVIDSLLRPQLDPWELLHQYLNRVTSGRGSRTWKQPNRRRFVMLGEYSPRSVSQRLEKICFMTDMSGSIGPAELRTFASEIGAVLSDVPFETAYCGWFDSDVRRVDEFTYPEEFVDMLGGNPPPGGGGTDFRPPFEWVRENLDDEVDVMIFITDGYGPSPSEAPPYPVIVLTTGENLPIGQNIPIKVGAR